MKALLTLLGGVGLALCSSVPLQASEPANTSPNEKVEVARSNELKGDLDRIHKDFDGAASHYRAAIKIEPHNAVLFNKLGLAYLQQGDRGSARKAFRQAVKLDPRFSNALNNLGAVALIEKKYRPALHYLKEALALDEGNASAHLNMAEAWAGMGDMDRAMNEYARALELNADILTGGSDGVLVNVSTPEQRGRVAFMIAKAYAKRGNLEGALEYLQRAKDNHFMGLAKVYEDTAFTGLWTDPRLNKIVKRPMV